MNDLDGGTATVRLVVSGLGAIGGSLLRLIADRDHGVDLRVVAAVDSSGAIVDDGGIDPARLAAHKAAGGRAVDLPGVTVAGTTVGDVLATGVRADLLVEAGPGDLETGGAGLAAVRVARAAGIPVVLAAKAPLVLAWDELTGPGPAVAYSACTGGALPTVTLLRATLTSARALRVEAALNGTSAYVLRLVEDGLDLATAVERAQRLGIAEPDPSWDLDGWDAACKLVLIANATLGARARLGDVDVRGVSGVTRDELLRARANGHRIVPLATAVPEADGWRLAVGPAELPDAHPLARMDPEEMGIVVHTDIAGRLAATTHEPDAIPSAAAVLRDILTLARAA
ncbi:homoserine dehydrogenase [Catenuloplanes atrovinosus]|uniref:Homoserine dehydrogenase n=1 Tax=Catenuloplanes atrovinosus TaxID=137266 RepID=A0AAE4C968_9ACTN|nr:homoserine dehydrogenase [Catenuloplanes atrovinosus]MDR7276251.1 homoserine dehydrogenase [Catenuloplanes atrovinosus]